MYKTVLEEECDKELVTANEHMPQCTAVQNKYQNVAGKINIAQTRWLHEKPVDWAHPTPRTFITETHLQNSPQAR